MKKYLKFFLKYMILHKKICNSNDVGTQYRSEIFYDNEESKKTAEEKKEFFNKKFNGKIETNISEIKNYYKAEEYHQKYIMKRGR